MQVIIKDLIMDLTIKNLKKLFYFTSNQTTLMLKINLVRYTKVSVLLLINQ